MGTSVTAMANTTTNSSFFINAYVDLTFVPRAPRKLRTWRLSSATDVAPYRFLKRD